MNSINLVIFPYRNSHFKKKYGNAVRDIQIIEILKDHPAIENILVIERPLSIYELLLGRYFKSPGYFTHYSFDVLGPFKGRSWTEYCYNKAIIKAETLTKSWENLVILDFTPIAKIQKNSLKSCFYWYDMIDNFTKHNRYSKSQKKLVAEKYNLVNKNADLVTGVTDIALDEIDNANKITMPNGVFPHESYRSQEAPLFKYGFFGFITDKFDVEFIKNLAKADPAARFILCGEILDKNIAKQLKQIENVTLHGSFSRKDTAELASKFKVGIIPYRKDKSHDGSPLKLYEYMWFGKPVLTSIDYEYCANFIVNYNTQEIHETISKIEDVLLTPLIDEQIKNSLSDEMYTEFRLKKTIEEILNKINSKS